MLGSYNIHNIAISQLHGAVAIANLFHRLKLYTECFPYDLKHHFHPGNVWHMVGEVYLYSHSFANWLYYNNLYTHFITPCITI